MWPVFENKSYLHVLNACLANGGGMGLYGSFLDILVELAMCVFNSR